MQPTLTPFAPPRQDGGFWIISLNFQTKYLIIGPIGSLPIRRPGSVADEIAIRGRGGTDFRPGFAWLDENGIQPGVCLYLTDMECSRYPETAPRFDVLWCNWGDPPSVWNREPWGERIDMAAP